MASEPIRDSSSHAQLSEEEKLKLLNTRRDLERQLIRQCDKTTINPRKECWYLMDSSWLNSWSTFVHSNGDLPGPVSSSGLLDSSGKVLPELKGRIDYRGVTPLVFYM